MTVYDNDLFPDIRFLLHLLAFCTRWLFETLICIGLVHFYRDLHHYIKLFVIHSVIYKRVFTPLLDLPTRIIGAVNHYSNSTMAITEKFTASHIHFFLFFFFFFCNCHCWVWRMIDSFYIIYRPNSSQKIRRGVITFFVDYRKNYEKLCYYNDRNKLTHCI